MKSKMKLSNSSWHKITMCFPFFSFYTCQKFVHSFVHLIILSSSKNIFHPYTITLNANKWILISTKNYLSLKSIFLINYHPIIVLVTNNVTIIHSSTINNTYNITEDAKKIFLIDNYQHHLKASSPLIHLLKMQIGTLWNGEKNTKKHTTLDNN